MDFYDTLKKVCIEHHTSISKLEKDLGFSNGSLSKGIPRADRLYKIANHFSMPMEAFITEDDMKEVLERYYNSYTKTVVPVYRASAGEGAYNDIYTAESISMGEEGYEYATVVGDSMLPELRDGDVIKIEPTSQTTARDYTLVKINGNDCTVKFVEVVDNGVWIRALNKEVFEDRFYSIQEVLTLPITIVGKVVAFRREFK